MMHRDMIIGCIRGSGPIRADDVAHHLDMMHRDRIIGFVRGSGPIRADDVAHHLDLPLRYVLAHLKGCTVTRLRWHDSDGMSVWSKR